MRSLTPDKTIQRLGWKAARRSLKETRSITAPKPPTMSWRVARKYLWTIGPWLKAWAKWPWRTVLFWVEIWKHSRKDFVKEYTLLAKQGVESREIFRRTKRRMHLTEDEISGQGRKHFAGYTRGREVSELFDTRRTQIPTGNGKFPTVISDEQIKHLR